MPKGVSEPRTVACRTCAQPFAVTNAASRYCSVECNFAAWAAAPNEAGCRLWTGAKDRNGYGVFWGDRANRVAWERKNGPIPAGLMVLHACDVTACVEEDHLMLGSGAANMIDRDRKGRQARGERNGNAKLSAIQIAEIRKAKAEGVTGSELAVTYGVDRSTINRASNGASWSQD